MKNIYPETEGFEKKCPRCNGKGEEIESFMFSSKMIPCKMCGGRKMIWYTTICPLMSSSMYDKYATPPIRFVSNQCRGDQCTLWDRDDGGCLWRKSLLNQVKKGVLL